MELQQALDFLAGKLIERQKEIDSLLLAQSILQNNFTPELDDLTKTKASLANKTDETEALKIEKENLQTVVTEKETTIATLETEKQIISDALVEANSRVDTLIQENAALTAVNEPVI